MTAPLYPSLIPRYVDESWFAGDQPVNQAAMLDKLEQGEATGLQRLGATPRPPENEDDASEEEDDDEMNEDDEEDDEDIDEGDDNEEDFIPNDSPPIM